MNNLQPDHKGWLHEVTRSWEGAWIAGVCSGLGRKSPAPPWAWRLLFTFLIFLNGTGIILYFLSLLFVPPPPVTENAMESVWWTRAGEHFRNSRFMKWLTGRKTEQP